MEVPHLMSTRLLECWLATIKASSATMSHALQQTKPARMGVICKSASSTPHFLLARVQLLTVFPICLSAYLLQLLSICVLSTAFKTFCSNKLGIHISTPCEHESNSLDVITAKHARNSRKVQENRVTWSFAMFRNRQWLFWDVRISVGKSTNMAL